MIDGSIWIPNFQTLVVEIAGITPLVTRWPEKNILTERLLEGLQLCLGQTDGYRSLRASSTLMCDYCASQSEDLVIDLVIFLFYFCFFYRQLWVFVYASQIETVITGKQAR